jgi:hypothetical protein
MDAMDNETKQLFEKLHREGWQQPKPSSYQIRKPDGSPGGWVAQVHIIKDTYDAMTYQPLLEKDPKIYSSKEEADKVAIRMGWAWLRQHAA